MPRTRIRRRQREPYLLPSAALVLVVLLFRVDHAVSFAAKKNPQVTIQVCQNKDCCQRFQGKAFSLVETIEFLMSDQSEAPRIESSGCLSQCGKGPNVQVTDSSSENTSERLYHQVDSVASAAAILELAIPSVHIHPTLVAAIKVLERAEKASTLDERETCLDSVISALDKKPALATGPVMAHAHVMQAQLRLDQGRPQQATRDAKLATELHPSHPTAWRVLADAYEATGDTRAAIQALTNWGKANPSFRTKAANEMQRLMQQQQ